MLRARFLSANRQPYTSRKYTASAHLNINDPLRHSRIQVASATDSLIPFKRPNQLYRNTGNNAFNEISGQAGPALQLIEVSRGAAFGDIDNHV